MPIATSNQESLDAVFAALGNPTRRSIVARLGDGDATISELAAPYDMSLPAVSKHLRILEGAGLVSRTKIGSSRRCSLHKAELARAEAWLAERRAHWEGSLDSLADYLESADVTTGDEA